MPTISQTLAATRSADISASAAIFHDICSASGLVRAETDNNDKPPTTHHANACGYCTLLADSAPVATMFELRDLHAASVLHDSPLLYEYSPPRPFRGQTNPLDPPVLLTMS